MSSQKIVSQITIIYMIKGRESKKLVLEIGRMSRFMQSRTRLDMNKDLC